MRVYVIRPHLVPLLQPALDLVHSTLHMQQQTFVVERNKKRHHQSLRNPSGLSTSSSVVCCAPARHVPGWHYSSNKLTYIGVSVQSIVITAAAALHTAGGLSFPIGTAGDTDKPGAAALALLSPRAHASPGTSTTRQLFPRKQMVSSGGLSTSTNQSPVLIC